MKSFASAVVAAALLAGIGAYVLDSFQESATVAYTTTGARI
jgi:hypothetical protein